MAQVKFEGPETRKTRIVRGGGGRVSTKDSAVLVITLPGGASAIQMPALAAAGEGQPFVIYADGPSTVNITSPDAGNVFDGNAALLSLSGALRESVILQKVSGVNTPATWRSELHSNSSALFTNVTRPLPTTVPVGQQIYNTDDNAPNYSRGPAWTDALGVDT